MEAAAHEVFAQIFGNIGSIATAVAGAVVFLLYRYERARAIR